VRVAGLFAGVGGIELGLEQAGLTTSLLCEIDPRAQAVLKQRFQRVRLEPDVTSISRLPRDIDLLTAGFPCQDLSQAGSTVGIRGRRSGLIRNVFRLITHRKPPWVLIENVPFLLRLDGGRGIAYVTRNLERLGYLWAYRVVDTRAFGLPHRRERVFLLASRTGDPAACLFDQDKAPPETTVGKKLAHGFYWTEGTRGLGWAIDAVPTIKGGSALGIPSPPAIWFPNGRFATPDIRDAERLQGFPVNWTRPAEKASRPSYRWTLVGNAVSVPVARWIGRRLLAGPATKPELRASELLPKSGPWPRAAFGGPGMGRFAVDIGSFPVTRGKTHLHEFLRFDPIPLSRRAANGFSGRLQRSSLARPTEFDVALAEYVRWAV
jgi:DNA (cytosine-5)-methyltransferase 1